VRRAIVLLSMVAVWPLFGGGMIVTGDTSHAIRIYEMHQCLSDGQLPCAGCPTWNGYGYPLFNYYPPLPYYMATSSSLGFSYCSART
jgi:uncharacterized membrane protein